MYCGNCGAKIKDGAKFCTECGSPIVQANSQLLADATAIVEEAKEQIQAEGIAEAMQEGQRRSKAKMSPLVLISLVLALMAGTAFAAYYVYTEVILPSRQAQGVLQKQEVDSRVATEEQVGQADADDEQGTATEPAAQRTQSYLDKIREYQDRYGKGEVEVYDEQYDFQLKQLNGLAIVELIDFDSNGEEELLLGYYDASADDGSFGFNHPWAYSLEVWAFDNNELRQVYKHSAESTNGGNAYFELYRGATVAFQETAFNHENTQKVDEITTISVLQDGAFQEAATVVYEDVYSANTVIKINGEEVSTEQVPARWAEVTDHYGTLYHYWLTEFSTSNTDYSFESVSPDAALQSTDETVRSLAESAEVEATGSSSKGIDAAAPATSAMAGASIAIDATDGRVALEGTLIKHDYNPPLEWSATVYELVFDQPIEIQYLSYMDPGAKKSNQFDRIFVWSVETYYAVNNSDATKIDPEWEQYVDKRVTIEGYVRQSTTAHQTTEIYLDSPQVINVR